ncbi:uncharacterized protein LOC117178585 [Belonocnema kinseyi]|uniref:uncharacterized protein LOC117178585 n=1 Tax=Belonocnema kinseyi TaxID=2817044 RepID=UPI00143D4924|nr:uncharacterized protein LOC117178585 [Belonocnema kinseyi]
MIHNDLDLPIIQKFHYLKGSVTGDAANIIASLETTSENYTVAWELLKGRYHNKKIIIDTHVKAIYDLKSISKEFSIRQLHDTVQKHLRALRALSIDVDQWNFILIHLIKSKLNNYTIEKWEEFVCETDLPTLKNMLDFLQRRSQLEETRAATYQTNYQKTNPEKYNANQKSRSIFTGATTSYNQNIQNNQPSEIYKKFTCCICKDEHGIFACQKFLAMSTKDRYESVKKALLCTNCLRGKHHPKDCLSSGCRKCGKRHNSLLHFEKKFPDSNSQNSQSGSSNQSKNDDKSNQSSKALHNSIASYQLFIPSEVVLATAIVDVIDDRGNMHACRVMLDSGSQPHVITEKFANKIGLKKMVVDIPLGAVNELATTIKYTTSATIKSRYNERKHHLSLFVVKSIGSTMPSELIDRKSIPIPKGVFLADPEFHQPSEVNIILGAQYFYQFLRPGQIPIANHEAVLQENELGWVVAGCFHQTRARQGMVYCNFTKFSDLPLLWEVESAREASPWSSEEEACELHYSKNTTRDSSGRYTVQLPFNEHKEKIGESRRTAFNRFLSLESKLAKNPDLKTQYSDCIQGQSTNNITTITTTTTTTTITTSATTTTSTITATNATTTNTNTTTTNLQIIE